MNLLRFREKINTECSLIGSPILNVKAIKIDANLKSLKQEVGCKNLKSCDYFRRKKDKFYFIELSDFHLQLENLKKKSNTTDDKKYIKIEVRLKLSDTLIIFQNLIKKYKIKYENTQLKNKVLLVICKENLSDTIAFNYISKELSRHYCPTSFSSIHVIPYTEIENIITR